MQQIKRFVNWLVKVIDNSIFHDDGVASYEERRVMTTKEVKK